MPVDAFASYIVPMLIKRQFGECESIVVGHEIRLVEAKGAGEIFGRQIRERQALNRVECREVGAPQPQLAVCPPHGLQQLMVALANCPNGQTS
jgi:hypothetical protein